MIGQRSLKCFEAQKMSRVSEMSECRGVLKLAEWKKINDGYTRKRQVATKKNS